MSKIESKANIDPDDYNTEDGFMHDCIEDILGQGGGTSNDRLSAEKACAVRWAENQKAVVAQVVHKVHASDDTLGMEFILSDATPDRYEDVIDPDGWVLDNFKRNPIALFNHDSHFPIGKWTRLGVKDGSLRGHLQMAPEGTSPRIDEIRKLIEAGILRATSVGFIPREYEEIPKSNGYRYTKSELVETSLVSVPANPNALAVAEKLGISAVVRRMVFAKHGEEVTVKRQKGPTIEPKKETAPVLERSFTWGGKKVVEQYFPTNAENGLKKID